MPRPSQTPRQVQFKNGDGHPVRVGACHRDAPDPAEARYRAARWSPGELPPKVDLRAHLTPVESQGGLGSCTADALAGAIEYLEKRIRGDGRRISRLFIYFNERRAEGDVGEDHGASLSEGIRSLARDGACAEELWPYDAARVCEQPPPEAYEAAAPHRIDEAHRVDVELHDLKHCLAEGYPFAFGLQLYEPFERDGTERGGRITQPDPGRDALAGGHAMLCVGYSDADETFLVRNSWGASWGDGGYCRIPYSYLADPRFAHDCWTLRRAHDLDFSVAHAAARGDPGSAAGPGPAPRQEIDEPAAGPRHKDGQSGVGH